MIEHADATNRLNGPDETLMPWLTDHSIFGRPTVVAAPKRGNASPFPNPTDCGELTLIGVSAWSALAVSGATLAALVGFGFSTRFVDYPTGSMPGLNFWALGAAAIGAFLGYVVAQVLQAPRRKARGAAYAEARREHRATHARVPDSLAQVVDIDSSVMSLRERLALQTALYEFACARLTERT